MGFLKRIFSIGGGKKEKKQGKSSNLRPHSLAPDSGSRPLGQEWQYIDTEAAVSRLLRSSSSRYNIVAEVDYSKLPPIPHPIDSISRSTSVSSTPSQHESVYSRNTYSVKILSREQHSLTEFPNAFPSLESNDSYFDSRGRKLQRRGNSNTDANNEQAKNDNATDHDEQYDIDDTNEQHRDSQAYSSIRQHGFHSTPNLLSQKNVPSAYITPRVPRMRQVSDPRRVPFTPHDNNRLSRLKQDPSVLSLLKMYDEDGRLDETAFSNTPPPHAVPLSKRSQMSLQPKGEDEKRGRRHSTFRELMSQNNEAKRNREGEGDLSWADRCIAESRTSSSTTSSAASTDVATPTNTAFDLARTSLSEDSHSRSNVTTKFVDSRISSSTQDICKAPTKIDANTTIEYPGISSLVVELSTARNSIESSIEGETNVSNILAGINDSVRHSSAQGKTKQEQMRSLGRTPSKRASQVFSFLNEKRPKRLSSASMPLSASSQAVGSAVNLATTQDHMEPQPLTQQASGTGEREAMIHARPLPLPSPGPSRSRPITPLLDTNSRSSGVYMHPTHTGSSASFRPLPIPKPSLDQTRRLSIADALALQGIPSRATTPDIPIETCLDHNVPLPSPHDAFPEPLPSPVPSPIIPPAVLAPVPTQIPLPPSRACTPVPLTASNNEPVVWTTADKAIAAHEEAEGRARARIRKEKETEERQKRGRREVAISLPSQRHSGLGLPAAVPVHLHHFQQLHSPAPAPPSPLTFHPLNPPPRPNARGRTASNSSSVSQSYRPRVTSGSTRGKSHSTDVADVARGRAAHARGASESNSRLTVWEIAQGRGRSTSPGSRPLPVPPAQRGHAHSQSASMPGVPALRERTNSEGPDLHRHHQQRLWKQSHAPSSFGGRSAQPGNRNLPPSLMAGRLSATELEKQVLGSMGSLEKENRTEIKSARQTEKGGKEVNGLLSVGRGSLDRTSSRRSSLTIQSVTSSVPSPTLNGFLSVPGPVTSTPYRGRSPLSVDTTSTLLAHDEVPPSPVSSSELSPDAQKMMADVRSRKLRKGKSQGRTDGKKRISILNLGF